MLLLALFFFQPIVEKAIEERAFPGAAIAIVQRGKEPLIACYGSTSYDNSCSVTHETLYDLASLTKVFATTTLLLDEDLDAHVVDDITPRHLLTHRSGFPAEAPPDRREQTLAFLENPPRLFEPGAQKLYSDIGFIYLGRWLEERHGMALDALFEERIAQTLGLDRLCFNPLQHGFRLEEIAPTELDLAWRQALVWGTVHDETAAILGGVAGHAGLFGSIADVAALLGWLLEHPSMPTFAKGELGWQRGDWGAGTLVKETSCSHLGFTGCSVYLDLAEGWGIALLTNRVHPTRDTIAIRKVRSQILNKTITKLQK